MEDARPGTRIDEFTIAFRLTSGMNTDVLAVWHHGLKTPLVCKRLRAADVADQKWRRLLRLEGSVLRRLTHPGIVRLIGENHRTPQPYLLFEHVGEKSLRDELILSGPLPIAQAVRIVQHVGGAVAYLHDRGYLHRDLKPANIIMRAGRPVLIDFGVVWKWGPERRPVDRSGTPQYLAPEQIYKEPLTPATDVYGLGILLYELITGRRPFPPGLIEHRDAPLEQRYPQLSHQPEPLHKASEQKVPRQLLAIINRCLEATPANRFPHVTDLLESLDPFTDIKVWPQINRRSEKKFLPFRVS